MFEPAAVPSYLIERHKGAQLDVQTHDVPKIELYVHLVRDMLRRLADSYLI